MLPYIYIAYMDPMGNWVNKNPHLPSSSVAGNSPSEAKLCWENHPIWREETPHFPCLTPEGSMTYTPQSKPW